MKTLSNNKTDINEKYSTNTEANIVMKAFENGNFEGLDRTEVKFGNNITDYKIMKIENHLFVHQSFQSIQV